MSKMKEPLSLSCLFIFQLDEDIYLFRIEYWIFVFWYLLCFKLSLSFSALLTRTADNQGKSSGYKVDKGGRYKIVKESYLKVSSSDKKV